MAGFSEPSQAGQRARFVPSSGMEDRSAESANPFRGMKAPVKKKVRRVPKEVNDHRIQQVAAAFEADASTETDDARELLWLSRSTRGKSRLSSRPASRPASRNASPAKRETREAVASAEPREFVAPKDVAEIQATEIQATDEPVASAADIPRPTAKRKRPARSRKFDPFEDAPRQDRSASRIASSSRKDRAPTTRNTKRKQKRLANDGTVAFQSEQGRFEELLAGENMEGSFVDNTSSARQRTKRQGRSTESAIERETIFGSEPGVEQASYLSCPDCGYAACACDGGYGYGCDGGSPGCDGGICDDNGGLCRSFPRFLPRPREFTVFAGVHAFKGPLDGNRDRGNFGFQEGFNWGGKLPWNSLGGVGYQIGYQLTHSQLSGSTAGNSDSLHTQQFVTAGLFRRPPRGGLQYGVVWDVLRDERNGSADYHQVRSEIGLINNRGREIGIQVAVHTNNTGTANVAFQSTDQFLVYYRIHAQRGGEARFYGGLDDDAAGILGAEMQLPVNDRLSVASGFTYLIPQEGAGQNAASEEAWNLGFNLVWHMGRRARSSHHNLYRPLFNVADNGSLMVDNR